MKNGSWIGAFNRHPNQIHIHTMIRSTLSVLTLILFAVSCSGGEEVNIYSARHYNTDLELYDRFTEETGIEINLIEGGSDELIERIRNEGVNSPADLFITVDAGRMWRADEADVLQSVQTDLLNEKIPASLRDPEGKWYGLSQRVRGIIYHRERVDPSEIGGYLDLADEKWNGRICVRSSNNIYNQSLVASMIEHYGQEETEAWAQQFVANFARDPQGGDRDQIRAIAAGECDIALANHYYLARLATSDEAADRDVADAVGIYFPPSEEGGTHVNISAIGVAKHAPNLENAVRFMEYLTRPDAQKFYIADNFEYSVTENEARPAILDEFGPFESDRINVSAYGENNPLAIQLMDRAGWR